MNEKPPNPEEWFARRRLTLDLANLSETEKSAGSILLGGSAAEFVGPEDEYEYDQINTVIFNWGDERAEQVFNVLLEHDDRPGEHYFPFNAAAVIGGEVWSLAVQEKDFDPKQAYAASRDYVVLPFEKRALAAMKSYLALTLPRPELLGKVGPRWVAFEMGTKIR